jgi:predicted TIM-barrel fold metal-dependent hydrolase
MDRRTIKWDQSGGETVKKLFVLLVLIVAASGCKTQQTKEPAAQASAQPVSGPFSATELEAFTALEPIDTHTHVYQNNPAFAAMLQRLHMHILDICVDDDHASLQKNLPLEIKDVLDVMHHSNGDVAFCTTFDPYKFRQRGFARVAIRQINHNFEEGAIAVKIWKNIGMELKDTRGRYILPDNPIFEPIYRDIAAHHETLIAHVADPDSAWEPPNPASPDYSYFKENPEWYMYGKPHPASKEQILRARDHILQENPNLRLVGAHLGSMESNFPELGQHLDRYPNFAVDMAARMPYVMMQPHATVIAFITKYQDRLIYGTDLDFSPTANPQTAVKEWENYYARDWRFLATNDLVEYHGRKYRGLNLPQPILHKIYHDNAVHWFPGILSEKP